MCMGRKHTKRKAQPAKDNKRVAFEAYVRLVSAIAQRIQKEANLTKLKK